MSWARRDAGLRTSRPPAHDLVAEQGASRVVGYTLANTTWANWLMASLLVALSTAAAFVILEPGAAPRAIVLIRLIGVTVSIALGVLAWALRLGAKRPLDILVLRGPRVITRRRLAAQFLSRPNEHRPAELWIVAWGGFTRGAIDLAQTADVRCLVPDHAGGFVDAVYVPETAVPVRAA